MDTTAITPKRGLRFRHAGTTTCSRRVRQDDGSYVDETTNECVITAVRWTSDRSDARVYWRYDFGEPGIGRGNWHTDLTPSLSGHRPGFHAIVAEWLN